MHRSERKSVNPPHRQPNPLRTRTKVLFGVLLCLGAIACVEQFTPLKWYYSRLDSTSSVTQKPSAVVGGLVFSLQVEQPFTRWIPLVKYGETVFHHSDWQTQGDKTVMERDATTRTRVLVIGLCSTEQYDHLASEPYEMYRRELQKR